MTYNKTPLYVCLSHNPTTSLTTDVFVLPGRPDAHHPHRTHDIRLLDGPHQGKKELPSSSDLVQGGWGGWPTGNGKKLSSSQAQMGKATCLAVA